MDVSPFKEIGSVISVETVEYFDEEPNDDTFRNVANPTNTPHIVQHPALNQEAQDKHDVNPGGKNAPTVDNARIKQERDDSANNLAPKTDCKVSIASDTDESIDNTSVNVVSEGNFDAKNSRFSNAHVEDLDLRVEDCSNNMLNRLPKQSKSKSGDKIERKKKHGRPSKQNKEKVKSKKSHSKITKKSHGKSSEDEDIDPLETAQDTSEIKQLRKDLKKATQQSFLCESCQMKFRAKSTWESHVCPVREGDMFKCQTPGCGKQFSSMKSFRGHAEGHANNTTSLMCDVCALRFPRQNLLDIHMLKHKDLRSFKCDFPGCDKAFKFPASLGKHKRRHTGDNATFVCNEPNCGKVFVAKSNLKRHVETAHLKRLFTCPLAGCDKTLTTSAGLQEHIEVMHTLLTFPCPVEGCGRVLSSKSTLSRHKRFFHSDERRFVCETCGEAFKLRNTLRVHLRTHKDGPKKSSMQVPPEIEEKRKFRCSFEGCNKGYTTKQSLTLHEGVHFGDSKTFSKARRHKRLHDNEASVRRELNLMDPMSFQVAFPINSVPQTYWNISTTSDADEPLDNTSEDEVPDDTLAVTNRQFSNVHEGDHGLTGDSSNTMHSCLPDQNKSESVEESDTEMTQHYPPYRNEEKVRTESSTNVTANQKAEGTPLTGMSFDHHTLVEEEAQNEHDVIAGGTNLQVVENTWRSAERDEFAINVGPETDWNISNTSDADEPLDNNSEDEVPEDDPAVTDRRFGNMHEGDHGLTVESQNNMHCYLPEQNNIESGDGSDTETTQDGSLKQNKDEVGSERTSNQTAKGTALTETSSGDQRCYRCDFPGCEKVFTFKTSLTRHKHVHTGDSDVFVCAEPNCGKVFPAKRNLKQHIETVHLKRKFMCPHAGCDKTLTSYPGLQEHIEVVHNLLTFPCPVEGCGKVLRSKSSFARHKRFFHSDERQFVCETCGEAFKLRNTLKIHLKTHGEESCSQQVPRKTTGKYGTLGTKEKRNFPCSFEGCNKSYTSKQSLTIHEGVHFGDSKTFSKAKRRKRSKAGDGEAGVSGHLNSMDPMSFQVAFPL